MPLCYWHECDCPDATPCTQHTGTRCGTFNGRRISKANEVNDTFTHNARLALASMDADDSKLNQIRARLLARRDELERVRVDIENRFASAQSYRQRSSAVQYAKQMTAQFTNVHAEFRKIKEDLDILERTWMWQGALLAGRCIVPFRDPDGYCSCYEVKKQRLRVIDDLAARRATQILDRMAQRRRMLRDFEPNIARFTEINKGFFVVGLATLIVYLIVGTNLAAAIALFLGLLVVGILLASALIDASDLDSRILRARRETLSLHLLYYRTQWVETCRRPQPSTDDRDWWDELWESLPPDGGGDEQLPD